MQRRHPTLFISHDVPAEFKVFQPVGKIRYDQVIVSNVKKNIVLTCFNIHKINYSQSRPHGHSITSRGRTLSLDEMMRPQGMTPRTVIRSVSDVELGKQVGNSMSVNVLERLFVKILPAVGLTPPLLDPWLSSDGLSNLLG